MKKTPEWMFWIDIAHVRLSCKTYCHSGKSQACNMHHNFLLSFQGHVVYLSLKQSCKQPICGKSDFCPAVSLLFVHSTKTWTGGELLTEGLIYYISNTKVQVCSNSPWKSRGEETAGCGILAEESACSWSWVQQLELWPRAMQTERNSITFTFNT